MQQSFRVLLVEDDAVDAMRVQRALRQSSRGAFEVTHAQHLEEALAHLACTDTQVVLLDLSLPDSDGVATVGRIQEAAPGVPIVVLTGRDDPSLVAQLLTVGVQDYITKGKEASEVLQRSLRYAVERHRLLGVLERERKELKDFVDAVRSGKVDTIVGAGSESGSLRLLDSRVVEENERLLHELKQANACAQAEIAERLRAEESLQEYAMTLATTNAALAEVKKDLESTLDQVSEANADLARKNAALDEAITAHAATNEALKEAQGSLADTVGRLSGANRALAQKNAELDEFTYVASHDIQEPLRKLVAFSDLLSRDLGDNLPEAARKDLEYITDAARRMQILVQDLLKLSRAGRVELKREHVSLNQCIQRALAALAARIEETSATITCTDLPECEGDATLLTQLYQNLIGNAMKFMPAGRQPDIQITAERHDAGCVFGVRDNGIGIAAEHAEQIFAPFKRLHGRSEYEGSGIGLAICRKAVERHGGRIWVESEPGQGSHFRFTLTGCQETPECLQTESILSSC